MTFHNFYICFSTTSQCSSRTSLLRKFYTHIQTNRVVCSQVLSAGPSRPFLNVYCQDNPISWLNWQPELHGREMLRFVTELLRYRAVLKEEPRSFFSLEQALENATIDWHGVQPFQPDWSENSHVLGLSAYDPTHDVDVYAFFNAWWEPLTVTLPPPAHSPHGHWKRVCDTGLLPPADITPLGCDYAEILSSEYKTAPRSVVVLICQNHSQ